MVESGRARSLQTARLGRSSATEQANGISSRFASSGKFTSQQLEVVDLGVRQIEVPQPVLGRQPIRPAGARGNLPARAARADSEQAIKRSVSLQQCGELFGGALQERVVIHPFVRFRLGCSAGNAPP